LPSHPILHNPAVTQRNHALAAFRHVLIMRHYQHCRSQPLVQITNQLQYVRAGVRIQIPGRSSASKTVDTPKALAQWRNAAARRPKVPQEDAPRAMPDPQLSNSFARSSIFFFVHPRRCNGIATFSKHVRVGSKLKKLKNEPDLVAPHACQVVIRQPAHRLPSISICPELGVSNPPIKFRSVDFPEPDGPMIATISPRAMARSTSSSAVTWRFPLNVLLTFARSITF